MLPRLQALRARTGGPDWILIDEVHHLLPTQWGQATYMLPQRLGRPTPITHRPSEVAPAILAMMDTAVAVGPSPALTLGELAKTLGLEPPAVPPTKRYEAIIWSEAPGSIPTPRSSFPRDRRGFVTCGNTPRETWAPGASSFGALRRG